MWLKETWIQRGTILETSSFEHKCYHHQTPASTTPGFDLNCIQPQGYRAGAPSQRYQAPGENYVTPLQLSIGPHASQDIFVSRNSRNNFGITCYEPKN